MRGQVQRGNVHIDSTVSSQAPAVTVAKLTADLEALRLAQANSTRSDPAWLKQARWVANRPPYGVDVVGNVHREFCMPASDRRTPVRLDIENMDGSNLTS